MSAFNPADKTANMTLTGSNLIATCSNSSNAGVRGDGSHDSASGGKFQLQFNNVTLVDSLDYVGIGIAADTLALAQGSQIQVIVIKDGTTFSGDGLGGSNALGTGNAIAAAATVDFCFDFGGMLSPAAAMSRTWETGVSRMKNAASASRLSTRSAQAATSTTTTCFIRRAASFFGASTVARTRRARTPAP